MNISDAPSLRESAEAVTEALVYAIANDLERSIANLGYPVGLGTAPHPDLCQQAARRMVERISDKALAVLSARKDGASPQNNGASE